MQQPIVMIGAGELGSVFARGFLRKGWPVHPVTRAQSITETAAALPQPETVLISVAEADLHGVLEQIPEPWKTRLCLLQNELLPSDWERHAIDNPTVISVWFEKKQGKDVRILLPSPVFGPHAKLIAQALGSIDIPTHILASPQELLVELVLKNVYIVTTNVCGLVTGGTVGELWEIHEHLAREVAGEVISIQAALTREELPREQLISDLIHAFESDLEHKCKGRSAPARLARALQQADALGVKATRMREISRGL